MEDKQSHIVVLGAGFGGLKFCQEFFHPRARITLVDRQNHHLFQPLLYQVASAGLSAPDIAQPIRAILSDRPNLTVRMDEVTGIDPAARTVTLGKGTLPYDYLLVALGGVTSYFGHPEWEPFAPGLKSLDDALRMRREILLAFEKAESGTDAAERAKLLTIVVVGGGPTGVELAGTFAELRRHVLAQDFDHIDPAEARVILLEGGPAILGTFGPNLAASAKEQLEKLGVEVRLNTRVQNITSQCVELAGGEKILAANIVWAAGVGASPLTKQLGAELDRAGRVKVNSDLSVPGHPEIFAVGDLASFCNPDGTPVPGVCPAAMQMGVHVAKVLRDELDSPEGGARPTFRYWDKGSMATIGRSAAVSKVGDFEISGFFAWLMWLFIHLLFLIGFRNKASVLMQWIYSYSTYKRGARIIVGKAEEN